MTRHCQRGHELSADNVALWNSGAGHPIACCRECNRERAKRWRKANARWLTRRKQTRRKQTDYGHSGAMLAR